MTREDNFTPDQVELALIDGRKHGFAVNTPYVRDLILPGALGFRYRMSEQGFVYEDCYWTSKKVPGKFAGLEAIRDIATGAILESYDYAGGLTTKGLEIGDERVTVVLQRFLMENAHRARLGVAFINADYAESSESNSRKWLYHSDGVQTPAGWSDIEAIHSWKPEQVTNLRKSTGFEKLFELKGNGSIFV